MALARGHRGDRDSALQGLRLGRYTTSELNRSHNGSDCGLVKLRMPIPLLDLLIMYFLLHIRVASSLLGIRILVNRDRLGDIVTEATGDRGSSIHGREIDRSHRVTTILWRFCE